MKEMKKLQRLIGMQGILIHDILVVINIQGPYVQFNYNNISFSRNMKKEIEPKFYEK